MLRNIVLENEQCAFFKRKTTVIFCKEKMIIQYAIKYETNFTNNLHDRVWQKLLKS